MRIHPIARFSFVLVLIAAFPVWAQFERYPTEAEINALIEQMRQNLPEMMEMGYHLDRRTAEERQARDAFANAWSEVDPDIAPFLGEWFALDEGLAIFPAANTGEVCIIDVVPEDSELSFGSIVDGKVYTDTHSVLVLDGDFLASTYVYNNEARVYEYSYPRPLFDPISSSFAEYHPDIAQRFQAAGCLAAMPE